MLLLWTRLVADGYLGDSDTQTDAPVPVRHVRARLPGGLLCVRALSMAVGL